jgi:hypothetical protein
MKEINLQQRIVGSTGHPTLEFMQLIASMRREVAGLRGRLDAIAQVAEPTGGATTDAEARAAINAIIDAAE